jgi:hypothetical protein
LSFDGNVGPHYNDDLFNIMLTIKSDAGETSCPIETACDFTMPLNELRCQGATFSTVRFQGGSTVQVVFDARRSFVDRLATRKESSCA